MYHDTLNITLPQAAVIVPLGAIAVVTAYKALHIDHVLITALRLTYRAVFVLPPRLYQVACKKSPTLVIWSCYAIYLILLGYFWRDLTHLDIVDRDSFIQFTLLPATLNLAWAASGFFKPWD